MKPRSHDVIVVGGGQAGLAIGHFVARQGRRFTILEAGAEPAAAWRSRWESLTLFTPARYDSLPGLAFPADPDSYPNRDEVVDYLTDYARHFQLPVELNSRVRAIRAHEGGYLVELDHTTYEADQVVVATGPFQVPRVPAIAADLHPDVVQLHSSEYRTPDALPPGPVLVVGGGNTGFQIAAELADSHEVHLSIGSRQMPLPQRIFGRDLFTWLEATGLMGKTVTSRIGRRMKERDTLIGSRPRTLRRRHGVELRGRTTGAAGSEVTFGDGTILTASTVIWATGFELDHSWIDVPVFDEHGDVVHERGVTASPGLFFLGLPWQHTRGSALLGWVADDAEHIAGQIDAFRLAKPAVAMPARVGSTPVSSPPEPVR
jgi:putative flavoprotein involved in K+ transport